MAECVLLTDAKYQTRPSPPYHAQHCKGLQKTGNDGQNYMSSPNKKGIYTWKPAPRAAHTYLTHDNGGRPFEVEDFGGHVKVHDRIWQRGTNGNTETYLRGKTLLNTPYETLFVGKDTTSEDKKQTADEFGDGNSILIQISKTKYIFVGDKIYSFSPVKGDTIRSYFSPIGNSDVPYPYALGGTHTYIMLDAVAIPNELLDLKDDIYEQWYFEGRKKRCDKSGLKRPDPYCRALLKDKVAVTRKLSIQQKRKTLKIKGVH
jgi:hypothetical protein